MARQLAMSTVVAWFGNLSFDQQKNALDRLQGEHDQSRSAKRAELVTQLAALGYAVAKKRGRPAGKTNGVGNGAVRKARVGAAPVPVFEVRSWPHGELAQEQRGRRRED